MTAAGLSFDEATHRYTFDGRELPSVTRILTEARLADFSAPWFTEAVRDRGSRVHAAIALDVVDALDDDTLDPGLAPYVAGWRRYVTESGIAVEHSEVRICDPIAGYAGTLDLVVREPAVARQPTRRTLLDIKPAIYPSVGPQTAAYARCARALYPDPVLLGRAALVLPGDGTYTRVPLVDRDDELTFLAALRIFQWRASHAC